MDGPPRELTATEEVTIERRMNRERRTPLEWPLSARRAYLGGSKD
jgi:hypothetical protein